MHVEFVYFQPSLHSYLILQYSGLGWVGDMMHKNSDAFSWCYRLLGNRPICFSVAIREAQRKENRAQTGIGRVGGHLSFLSLSSLSSSMPWHCHRYHHHHDLEHSFVEETFAAWSIKGLIIKARAPVSAATIIHIHEKSISAGLQEIL